VGSSKATSRLLANEQEEPKMKIGCECYEQILQGILETLGKGFWGRGVVKDTLPKEGPRRGTNFSFGVIQAVVAW
jgi:hypothetical protein